jgi:hypothetical protein
MPLTSPKPGVAPMRLHLLPSHLSFSSPDLLAG